jgi:hypothetical protein
MLFSLKKKQKFPQIPQIYADRISGNQRYLQENFLKKIRFIYYLTNRLTFSLNSS